MSAGRATASVERFVIAMIAWLGGTLIASRLADSPVTHLRWLSVIIAVCSAIPWAALVVTGIRRADEYARRLHSLALAIGFGGVGATVLTLDWLQRAHVVGPVTIGGIGFLVVCGWWVAGMLISARYYR